MTAPLVSVLIPTFNRACYVGDAVNSALNQTLGDVEVVVVDDGSTDATAARLAAVADPRLRVVRHETNRGIPATRNTALAAAGGRYIAWLDSDDIARPHRLAEQVRFLNDNPDVAMVGACAGKLRPDGTRAAGVRVPPLSPSMIAAWMLFRSAFQQSSVTGRAEVLRACAYDPAFPVCEDVDVFLRLQRDHRLANLPRVLVDRRLHPGQTIRRRRAEIRDRREALAAPMLERLGIQAGADDLRRHVLLGRARLEACDAPRDLLDWAPPWLCAIQRANARAELLDAPSLRLACDWFWLTACRAAAPHVGRAAAVGAMLRRPPGGLLSAAAYRWAWTAAPVYLERFPVGSHDRRRPLDVRCEAM